MGPTLALADFVIGNQVLTPQPGSYGDNSRKHEFPCVPGVLCGPTS